MKNGKAADFTYAGGQPATMTYDGATYYYVYNGQGDVIGLTKADGTLVMGYTYGAWGTATGLAMDAELTNILITVNPFTYRGYVYDTGTSLYYLQSRYYDPELGRFINADNYLSTSQGLLGNNSFVYCLNNPLLYSDTHGTEAIRSVPTSEVAEWWLGVGWVLCCIDGALPIIDIVYFTTLTIFCATTLTSSQAKTETKAEVIVMTVTPGDNDQTIYTVYFLYAANDPNKAIIYVGRVKSANFEARMSYHASVGRLPAARIDGLTYEECRYVEQAGMIYFHTIGRGEPYKNQIRGISPTNPARNIYLKAGHDLTGWRIPENWIFPEGYLANMTENELLNLGS